MAPPSPSPADELVTRLYDELRMLARAHLRRERTGHTLETAGLVNEAYLRLALQPGVEGMDRARFFAVASATMRRVLVDYARKRKRQKRGGGQIPVPLEEVEALLTERDADELLALDEVLERFEAINPRGAAVVRHRFFAGLSLEETAGLLGISSKTVQREWVAARAWLRKEVARELDLLNGAS